MRQLLYIVFFVLSCVAAVAQERHPLLIGGFGKSDANNGELFSITDEGHKQTIKEFGFNTDGGTVETSLIKGADGMIYGNGTRGGSDGFGVLFRFNTDGTGYEVIHSFGKSYKSRPMSNLLQLDDGRLLGVQISNSWVFSSMPRVYRVNPDGSNFEVLSEFPRMIDMVSGLINTPHGIFGVGRVSNVANGFIYRLDADGTNFSIVREFTDIPFGPALNPFLLFASNGYLYGSTNAGGDNDLGTIYRIKTDGSDFSIVRHFAGWDGHGFRGNLVELGGLIYGATGKQGGFGVFEMTLNGSFNSFITQIPLGDAQNSTGLSVTSDGKLLFTVESNSIITPNVRVMVVEPSGANLTTMETLLQTTFFESLVPMIDDGTGSYFGFIGSIVKVKAGSPLKVVKKFIEPDGATPNSDLLMGPDGFIYGVTSAGGEHNRGTIFKVKRDGAEFTVLKSLNSVLPEYFENSGPLMLASNGYLYGVQTRAGTMRQGLLYRIKPDGTDYSEIHLFDSATEGTIPSGSLVEINGRIYGTLMEEPSVTAGALYSVNLDGTGFVNHHVFSGGPDLGGLKELAPGVLFGQTIADGANNLGYLYKYDINSGGFTKLFDFRPDFYHVMNSNMVRYENNLYGLYHLSPTSVGIFKANTDGTNVASLLTIDSNSGGKNGLALGNDGYFYWQTGYGFGTNRIYRSKVDSNQSELLYESAWEYPIRFFTTLGLLPVPRTPQQITFAPIPPKIIGTAPFDPGATASSGLDVTYASSDPDIASIVAGKIQVNEVGSVTITATQAGNTYFEPAVLERTLTIIQTPTVTGTVVLDVGADHSGISVKFVPISPSARETETITTADGHFTAEVVAGVYDVVYSKDLFQSATVLSIYISTDVTLQSVTLSSKPVTNVCGNVSGTWTAASNYKITCDVTIPAGMELKIEAGAGVLFDAGRQMTVNGKLTVMGTAASQVLITSSLLNKSPGDWRAIHVNGGDTTKFSWCTVEYGGGPTSETLGSITSNGKIVLDHTTVQNSSYTGLRSTAGYLMIRSSRFLECDMVGLSTSADVSRIMDSEFGHNYFGLNNNSSPDITITGNRIHHSGYSGVQTFGSSHIERNLFYNNGPGPGLLVSGFKSTIVRNTFYSNNVAIQFYDNDVTDPGGTVSSNIFSANSGAAIYSEASDHMPEVVEYNLVDGNSFFNHGLPGLGVITTANSGGNPSDTYYNFFAPADFFSTTASDLNYLYLNPTSPAIDAGDPDLTDMDGTTADCGAIPYQKFEQVITFDNIPNAFTYGDSDVTLIASATSGLPVTFTSSNTEVATINENVLTIVGAGAAEIKASQPGNASYKPADPVIQSVVVAKKAQSIEGFTITDRTVGDPRFILAATSTSGLSVQFTSSSDRLVVAGSEATVVKAGRVAITATQGGNNNFLPASQESSICIKPAKPVVTASTQLTSTNSQLTSDIDEGNQWYLDGAAIEGATLKTFSASASGSYSIRSTVDDCVGALSEAIILTVVGMEDAFSSAVEVYPNPVQTVVTVQTGSPGRATISIIDVLGRVIESRHVEPGISQFDISALSQGLFFVKINTDGRTDTRPVLKK